MQVPFPYKGNDKGRATSLQPPDTSPHMNNVRLFDVLDERARGGQRPGLDKWSANRIGDVYQPVVAMCTISSVAD